MDRNFATSTSFPLNLASHSRMALSETLYKPKAPAENTGAAAVESVTVT